MESYLRKELVVWKGWLGDRDEKKIRVKERGNHKYGEGKLLLDEHIIPSLVSKFTRLKNSQRGDFPTSK